MKRRLFYSICAVALITGLITSTGTARSETGFPGGRSWAIGAAITGNSRPFIGHETQVFPVPFVVYSGRRLHVTGPDASYTLFDSPFLSLDTAAGVRFEGFDPEASGVFAGMANRNPALELGLNVDARILSLQYRADVTGTHRGHEIRLTHSFPIPIRFGAVIPTVRATWKSADLVDYYYGVRDSEANGSRNAYRPGSNLQFGTGLEFIKQISWDWMVMGSASHEFLSSTIKDSPIVEDGGQTSVTFAFIRIL